MEYETAKIGLPRRGMSAAERRGLRRTYKAALRKPTWVEAQTFESLDHYNMRCFAVILDQHGREAFTEAALNHLLTVADMLIEVRGYAATFDALAQVDAMVKEKQRVARECRRLAKASHDAWQGESTAADQPVRTPRRRRSAA